MEQIKILKKVLAFTLLGLVPVFAGANLFVKSGMVYGGKEVRVTVTAPEAGKKYNVKVNFLKAESTEKVAALFLKSHDTDGSLRAALHKISGNVKSSARFDVLDAAGQVVGSEEDIGVSTIGKGISFQGSAKTYTVVIRCASGGGAYHLVFEYK